MEQHSFDVWKGKSRLALLVGIDDYRGEKINPLNGCVNDIDSLAAILEERFEFGVVCLRDRQATRDAMLEAMRALLEAAKENDQIVFAFSGHGASLGLKSGDTFETLVPCDSSRTGEWDDNRDITDREMFGWVWQISEITPFLTLIIDACRCGSIVRDFQARARGAAGDHGNNAGIARTKIAFTETAAPSFRARSGSGWLPVSDRYTLLAACLARENCREFEDPATRLKRGLFSYHLHRALIDLENKVTWRDLFDEVAAAVARYNAEQHPQLEGKLDLAIFGQEMFKPRLFLPVHSLDGDEITLEGGAAHGVHLGSQWSLQPPGSQQLGPDDLGILRIERVGPTRSQGRLIDPSRPALDYPALRAFEVSRPVDARYRVLLDGAAAADRKLVQLLEKSPYLHLRPGADGADGAAGDVVLHLLPARRFCPEGGPLPQLPQIEVQSWGFVDSLSGAQLAPLHSAASHGHRERVVHKLETLARHAFLLRLEHPGGPLAEHLKVEIRAYHLLETADRRISEKRELGQGTLLSPGDRIGFQVSHDHPFPLEVTLLSLGLTGGIEMLFPVRGRNQHEERAKVLQIGFQQADALEIGLPDPYPFAGEPRPELVDDHLLFLFNELKTRGRELLAQEPLRSHRKSAKGTGTPLDLALQMFRGGEKLRQGSSVDALERPEAWGLYRWKLRLRP